MEDSEQELDTESGDETEISLRTRRGGEEEEENLEEASEKTGKSKKALDPTIDYSSSDDEDNVASLTDMEHEIIKRKAAKGAF